MGRLQTSGTISIDDLATELGGSSPNSLEDYYRNGSNTPSNSVNSGVPTSGQINLEDFYGADGTEIITANASKTEFGVNATASVRYVSNGNITVTDGTNRTWHSTATNSGIGSDYQIRAILSSGTTPSGPTLGSWHSLSTSRTWSLTRTTVGTSTCTLTITIRTASGSITVDTGSCTISAIREP